MKKYICKKFFTFGWEVRTPKTNKADVNPNLKGWV
tara:strand:- start:478 stop:582 length:105 start_codon:yes stop_codon:yes gene_type:complete